MPTLDEVIADPEFHALPAAVRERVVAKIDPEFAQLPPAERRKFVGMMEQEFAAEQSSVEKEATGPSPSGGGKYPRMLKELGESAGAPVGCQVGVAASPLPPNGKVWSYQESAGVAPLEIRVQGADQYLVKLERNGDVAAMMLIRASSTAKMRLPLGDYVLKYAAGSGEYWCGEGTRFPFGRQTAFHKADEIFSFTRQGNRYSGYTIELFLQSDGNLSTSPLPPQAW